MTSLYNTTDEATTAIFKRLDASLGNPLEGFSDQNLFAVLIFARKTFNMKLTKAEGQTGTLGTRRAIILFCTNQG